jgi:DNA-binding transcriptional ArsR family regulator
MVTVDDACWLADHLRKMVTSRPAAWAGSEITLAQLMALHVISARAPITLMSEALGIRPPATSALVDRLARAGLVCRMPDAQDRRRVLLAVTGKARAMIGKSTWRPHGACMVCSAAWARQPSAASPRSSRTPRAASPTDYAGVAPSGAHRRRPH